MIYKHKINGVIVNTPCEIKGDLWIEVKKEADKPQKTTKKASEKKEDK